MVNAVNHAIQLVEPDALPPAQSHPLGMFESSYPTRVWGSTSTRCSWVESLSSSERARHFVLHVYHRTFFKLFNDKMDFDREVRALKELPTTNPFLWVPANAILLTNEELEDDFGICPSELKNYTSEEVYGFEYRWANETLTNLIEINDEEYMCSLDDKAGFRFKDAVWRAILRSAAVGIVQMHRKDLVHLDIKPANVVVHYAAEDIKVLKADSFKRYFSHEYTDSLAALTNFGSALKVGQKIPEDTFYTPYSHPDMDNLEAIADQYYDWFSFAIVVLEVLVLKKRFDSIFTVKDGDGELLMPTKEAYEMSKADLKRFPEDVGNRLKASPYKEVVDWACKVFAREGDPKNYGQEFISLMDSEWFMAYATFYN